MEFIFEVIVGLILDGSIEISKNSKVPNYIRYPLIAIISGFLVAVIGLIFLVGVLSLGVNIGLGFLLILLGFSTAVICIVKFRKIYLSHKTGK
jgi:predicted permease